jgi:hypothetical protein
LINPAAALVLLDFILNDQAVQPCSGSCLQGSIPVSRQSTRQVVNDGVEHQGANYSISSKPLLTAYRQEIHNQFIEQQRFLGMQPVTGIRDDPCFRSREKLENSRLMLR